MRRKLTSMRPRVKPKFWLKRSGGPVPGPRVDGKLSTEMRYRSESALESIRNPKRSFAPMRRWKLVRGDTVQVIQGLKDVGRRGKIIEVIRRSHRVVVEGVNIVTKYAVTSQSQKKRPTQTECPIHVSNVAIVCPETDKPSKLAYRYLEDGQRVRIAKVSGAIVPRPTSLRERRKPHAKDGPKDTEADIVLKRTYFDTGLVSLLEELKIEQDKAARLKSNSSSNDD